MHHGWTRAEVALLVFSGAFHIAEYVNIGRAGGEQKILNRLVNFAVRMYGVALSLRVATSAIQFYCKR